MANAADRVEATEAERSLAAAPRPKGEPEWLEALRGTAMAQFGEFGLPHRRIEAWRYTDVRAKLSGRYEVPAAPAPHPALEARLSAVLGGLPAVVVRLVDGQVEGWARNPLAPPKGVEISSFAEALARDPDLVRGRMMRPPAGPAGAVGALNTGLARDGVVVTVNRADETPPLIVLAHLSAPQGRPAFHLRHIISLGEGASADVLEIYLGADGPDYVTTVVSDIHLAKGARLTLGRIVCEGAAAAHLSATRAAVGEGARFDAQVLATGGALARIEIEGALAGRHAAMRVGAALLLDGERHGDLTLNANHTATDGVSQQDVRAVLAGRSRGVVQGAVSVARDAQRTDGRQLIRGLLLSPRAEFDAKPELEILADDVKCSHGATCGDLDGEALFYLRARGIPEGEARALLVKAFLDAGLETFSGGEALKRVMTGEADLWLAAHALGGGDA